jgi:predicted dehydrogenase
LAGCPLQAWFSAEDLSTSGKRSEVVVTHIDRRRFLGRAARGSVALAAGWTILSDPRSARAAPANDRVTLAVVGCGQRGLVLAENFAARDDSHVATLCDVNQRRLARAIPAVARQQGGAAPQGVADFRTLLQDPSIDAVVLALPVHWHALATVWACEAGKDVYVEKPICHNAWEGQQMLQAARRHQRVVQVGTQNRSAAYNRAAQQYLAEGKLGKVHFVRILNQKALPEIAMVADSPAPAYLDWEMWNGPAPEHAYNETLHRQWRYFWRYAIGDIANDGIHQLDLARMLVGFDLPKQVYCTGGRFNAPGAGEIPDTQLATFTYDQGLVVTMESTLYTPYMLKIDPEVRNTDLFPYWPQTGTRIEIYGEQGVMTVGRMGGGWQVFVRTQGREPVVRDQHFGRFPDGAHQENFIRCVRSRAQPNADIQIGHTSQLALHYATMSLRTGGTTLNVDPQTEHVDDAQAMQLFRRPAMRAPWSLEKNTSLEQRTEQPG